MIGQIREAGLGWVTLLALVALGILAGLGTWQLQRKAWKDKLVAQIDARLKEPPKAVTPAQVMTPGAGQLPLYTRVTVEGRLLHEHERYLFADGREGSGFHVLTPLEMAPGRIVWVNRGYVPARLRDPKSRAEGQIAGPTRVTGLVREQGERNAFTPDNDVAGNLWYWRDLPGLTRSAFPGGGTDGAPIAIDAEAKPENPGGWPRGGTTLVKLPNRHLEYAMTWYGLGLTLIGVYLAYATGRIRAAKGRGGA
ncbi:MAG TPA: SURF1 family protein [Hyphomicrobiaceae bacterium]|nr:SURF1 family protein [Hyphomicrobiaceae bacterium]